METCYYKTKLYNGDKRPFIERRRTMLTNVSLERDSKLRHVGTAETRKLESFEIRYCRRMLPAITGFI